VGRTIIPTEASPGFASGGSFGRPRKFYFTRAVSGPQPPRAGFGFLDRAFALVAFAALVAFYVALPSLKFVGVPLRGVMAVGLLGFLIILYPAVAQKAFRTYLPLILLAAGFAVLGIFTSAVNAAPVAVIVQIVMEVHLQIMVIILVAGMLAEICGARLSMFAIVAVIGISALFALLQMFDVDRAWAIRASLGPFAKEELHPTITDRRPTGLSYSPIQLSTQLCLAFGAFAAVRWAERVQKFGPRAADPAVLIALVALLAGSIAAATRSPILGGAIFLGVYLAVSRNSWLPLALLFGGALAYFAWPLVMGLLESEAPRILRTDDKSAAARTVFAYYGVRLFLDNPIGYGFGFAPSELWAPYWPELYMMRGARGTQEHMLHNYVLSMINIYGVGILLLAPLAIKLLRRTSVYFIFFIPYAVHILFHNSGPYFSDTIIWFVIAAIGAATIPTSQGLGRAALPPPKRTPSITGRSWAR
jgi:hypothetical protein